MRRLKFKCWNCEREFSLLLDTEEKPDLLSECPYCAAEVLIELDTHRSPTTTVFRGDAPDQNPATNVRDFPNIIPTRKLDKDAP